MRASSSGDLVMPRTHICIGDRAYSVAAPQAWNRLPTNLKLLLTTDTFWVLTSTENIFVSISSMLEWLAGLMAQPRAPEVWLMWHAVIYVAGHGMTIGKTHRPWYGLWVLSVSHDWTSPIGQFFAQLAMFVLMYRWVNKSTTKTTPHHSSSPMMTRRK